MIGIIADDITGANDIGIMFSKSNYSTHVFSYDKQNGWASNGRRTSDVVILDTDSRLDSPETAYEKVFQATKDIQDAGAQQFFNKTCSVFRGNIGTEFDAMLDALEEEFAVIILGFPKNGRTTVDGTHYVHDRKLEDSEFKNDPVHPMSRSDLVEILQSQTKRKVGLIDHTVVKKGADLLKSRISEMEDIFQYVIIDVTDQEDLMEIAKAVKDSKIICGSSALAEELPKVWEQKETVSQQCLLSPYSGKGILCVAGSLTPQTVEQIDYMRGKNVVVKELATFDLMKMENSQKETEKVIHEIIHILNRGIDVIFHTSNSTETVKATKKAAIKKGLSNEEVSRFVSATMAEIVTKIMECFNQNRLIVAGGDTSAAVCDHLGITGMRICEEIEPGLPSCVSLSDPHVALVLKSGSFGTKDFFEKAFSHLKSLRC